jgi:hypothetical protein
MESLQGNAEIGRRLCAFIFCHLPLTLVHLCTFQTGLLLTNAILILNRRRFLARYGLDNLNSAQAAQHPVLAQAGGLLHAVQYLKVPVIVCNIITIFFEILLGS